MARAATPPPEIVPVAAASSATSSAEPLLYCPAPDETQLTLRALAVGLGIGCLVASMNLYFGLRTGFSLSGSLMAAILSYGLFALLRPRKAFSVLETNIAQTAGSAAGSMASAGGLLAPIPALHMLGVELGGTELLVWTLSVASLGVFLAVPLRRQMILVERLRFPTGTATAETIVSMFASGEEARRKARVLVVCGLGAGAFSLLSFFMPALEHPSGAWLGASAAALGAWGFSLLISPMMFGAGMLIGPRVGVSLILGAVLGWGVVGFGLVQRLGWADGPVMSYTNGPRGWILWPGVAMMVAEALTSLGLLLPRLWRSWQLGRQSMSPPAAQHGEGDVSIRAWGSGLLVASLGAVVVSQWVFDIPWYLTVVALLLSAILAVVAVRASGETDINPVGGVGKVTQLAFGALAPGAVTTNLMAAAISGAGASQACDLLHDLKAGHLLRASPRRQLLAQLAGVLSGSLAAVPVFLLFRKVYDLGGEDMPAPAAHSWKAMAQLLAQGAEALPQYAGYGIGAGLAIGIAMPCLRLSERLRPVVPSALAMGIAFIIPAYYALAMATGALALWGWRRRAPGSASVLGFAVASGLVAGDGLMGVIRALLTLLGVT